MVLKGERRGGGCCSLGLDSGPDLREFKRTGCWFGWRTVIRTIYAASLFRPQRDRISQLGPLNHRWSEGIVNEGRL